jgi:hypothetical protein
MPESTEERALRMKCARVFATLLLSLSESEDEDIQREMLDRL